ncbi:MAG TPA: GntR family transcriptional regulator [Candidatus Sulfomarinibacteraceae bacterium]|nr:GntR family transcriptional regulator [Candidatus Sulfomarinibacteraceae bacterium]
MARKSQEQIYEQIRDRICLLHYAPGTVLSENALASEFGVSRTPVRSALQRLEYEGLVSSLPGVGTMVTSVDLKVLKEVYAFRIKLAEIVGDLTRNRVPGNTIELLQGLLEECRQMYGGYNPEAIARLYNDFHDEMLNIIGNEPLRQIYNQLYYQTARVWLEILPDLEWEKEVDITCDEIAETIAALEGGDLKQAARVRRDYMSSFIARMNSYLASADSRV